MTAIHGFFMVFTITILCSSGLRFHLTEKPAKELAVLARSWSFPAELRLAGGAFESRGYDKNQRAHVRTCRPAGASAASEFTLAGSARSPVLNPAFVVKDWGDANARLTLDGKEVPHGRNFRFGHRRDLEGIDLIVWTKTEEQGPLDFRIEPR